MRPFLWLALLMLAVPVCADWSFTDQKYSCTMNGMTFQELANAGVTYVSHVPATPEVAAEAHRWGIKIMPYVSLYKVIDTRIEPAYKKAPFWKEIDLAAHPDWALYRPDGKVRLPFDDPNYPRGLFQSCCNQPGILEAYVRGVQNVIATGADGVFVDNVHPYPKCYGPDLGLHQHLQPDKTNTEMYKLALAAVYKAVQGHGPDFATMLNSGGPSHDYIGYGDTLMWESFVFRWAEKDWQNRAVTCRTLGWPAMLRAYESWKDFTEGGGSIAPYTYLPVPELEKPHAYLAFVCAKLCGFQQWTASGSDRMDILRQLLRADLGKPTGPLEHDGTVYFRRYAGGLVVGNSAAQPARVSLPWAFPGDKATDMYEGAVLPVRDGRLAVEVPADCGRVYVTPQAHLANLLGETAGMAQSLALRLEKLAAADEAVAEKQQLALKAYRQANEAWQAVAKRGLPTDAAGKARITQLPSLLTALEDRPQSPVQGRLLSGGVRAEALPDLLRAKQRRPFAAVVQPDAVRLSSGGADFVFANGTESILFTLGDTRMTLWAQPGLQPGLGWLHGRKLQDARLVVDKPDEKTVAFVVTLYAGKSGQDVAGADVTLEATIRRDVPAIEIKSALRNHTDKPAAAYWFWNLAARYHTFPDGSTIQPTKWGDVPKGATWDYLHPQQDAGGVVLTGWTALGYGGGQADVFAEPRTQTIPAQGEMPSGFTAYAVGGASGDAFVAGRLRWYEQYASLAAQMVAGTRLSLQAPPHLVAGAPAEMTVTLAGADAESVTLVANCGGKPLDVTPGTQGRFVLGVPDSLAEGDRVDLAAQASFASGKETVTLRTFGSLSVQPALQLTDVRQAPGEGAALALAAVLRSNLPAPLPVTVQARVGDGPKLAPVQATLPPGVETAVSIPLPGLTVPANADRLAVALTVAVQPAAGAAFTQEYEREVTLLPQAICQTAANPPVIDGKLADSPWTFATKITGFVQYETGQPAKEQTVCLLMNDDANLYLGFTCLQANAPRLRASAKPDANGLNADVCKDDSVEIYVDPRQGRPVFRLVLNSLGAAKSTATGGWQVATNVQADHWTVEARIPLKLIGAPPKTGEVWGLNVCRNNWSAGEETCWSRSPGGFADASRFGGLKFETGGH